MESFQSVKRRFENYKKSCITTTNKIKTELQKNTHLSRGSARLQLLNERRNMDFNTELSPCVSSPIVHVKEDRASKLRRWKLEKEMKKQEQLSRKKPAFKNVLPHNVGFPKILGVPSSHKFRPPKNVKPISSVSKPNTRSQKPILASPISATRRKRKITGEANKENISKTDNKRTRKLLIRQNAVAEFSGSENVNQFENKIVQPDAESGENEKKITGNPKKNSTRKITRNAINRDVDPINHHEAESSTKDRKNSEEEKQNGLVDSELEYPENKQETSENRKKSTKKTPRRHRRSIIIKTNSKTDYAIKSEEEKYNGLTHSESESTENEQRTSENRKKSTKKTPRRHRRSIIVKTNSKTNYAIKSEEEKYNGLTHSESESTENEQRTSEKRKNSTKKPSTRSRRNINTKTNSEPEYATKSEENAGLTNSGSENELKTPDNKRHSAYVSPFVTTSRGKGSVRKENMERSIRGLPSFTEYTTPDRDKNTLVQTSGAQYFHRSLNNEIEGLQQHCKEWEDYKNTNELSENAKDMIDVAVGQANLLITKKFVQFRDLIHACENGPTGDSKPVTCEDLQGFWDMIYMQVDQLNTRFGKLEEMKNNNWEEILPEVVQKKVVKKSASKRKMNKKPKAAATSSSLQAAIAAARKKQNAVAVNNETENVFNGGFFTVKSPQKTPRKTPRKSQSLRHSVLSSEAHKRARRRVSTQSPGIIMKVSQSAKEVATPGRSILKNSNENKNVLNKSKAVLFKDD